MSDDTHRFTSKRETVSGEGEVQWGESGWSDEIDTSHDVDFENGVVQPQTDVTLEWTAQAAWDGAQSRQGVISRGVGVNVPDQVAMGYDPQALPGASNLVGYWSFDETSGSTLSETVNGWDASTYNGPSLGQTGVLGTNAVYFGPGGGPESYTKAPLGHSNQFTVAVVGRPIDSDGTGNTGWLQAQPGQGSVSTTGSEKRIGIWGGSQDTALWGRIVDSSGAQSFSENRMLTQGEWHVVTITADGSNGHLYANGDEVSTVTYDGTVQSYDEVVFGRQADESFGGDISLVAFWNTALSGAEVQQLSDTLQSGHLTTGVKQA